tara:strand:- start:7534 stop:8277 length:744 start_codon:yes stop_codon:yes gene_type:complete
MNDAIKLIYNFVWADFCDWYIEFSKSRIYGQSEEDKKVVLSISTYILKDILKLIHPFAPFISEEIWSYLNESNFLSKETYPEFRQQFKFEKKQKNIELFKSIITSIRNIKSDLGVSPKKELVIYFKGNDTKTQIIKDNEHHLFKIANVKEIKYGSNISKPEQSASSVINNLEFFIPLQGLINIDKEVKRLKSKLDDIEARLNNVQKKLNNENFINKAPQNIIDHEKNKYKAYYEDYQKILKNYKSLT